MAIAYQSVQSASIADSSLVITKPTSLAVGDTMLAGIYFSDDSSGSGGINTPSGWTLLNTTTTGTPAHEVLAIFIKEADSSDVAASNFTFTRSGSDSAYHLIGHILRITDFGINAGSSSNSSVAGVTTLTLTGFTPSRANSLFVGFLANSAASTQLNTSIALTTNNPSWTERAETSQTDTSRRSTLSVYTASRPEATATGDITATYATSVPSAHAYCVSLSPQVDGSITPTTYVNAYAINPNIPFGSGVDAIVENPTTATSRSKTSWVGENKPTTTWTRELL